MGKQITKITKANRTYNIYCYESCHLENDHKRFMFLGDLRHKLEGKDAKRNKIERLYQRRNATLL